MNHRRWFETLNSTEFRRTYTQIHTFSLTAYRSSFLFMTFWNLLLSQADDVVAPVYIFYCYVVAGEKINLDPESKLAPKSLRHLWNGFYKRIYICHISWYTMYPLTSWYIIPPSLSKIGEFYFCPKTCAIFWNVRTKTYSYFFCIHTFQMILRIKENPPKKIAKTLSIFFFSFS